MKTCDSWISKSWTSEATETSPHSSRGDKDHLPGMLPLLGENCLSQPEKVFLVTKSVTSSRQKAKREAPVTLNEVAYGNTNWLQAYSEWGHSICYHCQFLKHNSLIKCLWNRSTNKHTNRERHGLHLCRRTDCLCSNHDTVMPGFIFQAKQPSMPQFSHHINGPNRKKYTSHRS